MRKSIYVISICLLVLTICILIAGWATLGNLISQHNATLVQASAISLQDIEQYLGISVPSNAGNVTYLGTRDRGVVIDLNLSVPSQSAADFLASICSGHLYQGYNPFNAMNFREPGVTLNKIVVDEFVYYSYSPTISNSQFGNRCGDSHGGTAQVLVDKSVSTSYSVRIRDDQYCNFDAQVKPCDYDVFDTKPLSTSPVVFRNVDEAGSGLSWWCIDLDNRDDLSAFVGSDVRVAVDGAIMKDAHVSSDGRLNSRTEEPSSTVFSYCLDRNSKIVGSHRVNVTFLKPNVSFEYSLQF